MERENFLAALDKKNWRVREEFSHGPVWGITSSEAVEALVRVFGVWHPPMVVDGPDEGILLCGYDELEKGGGR